MTKKKQLSNSSETSDSNTIEMLYGKVVSYIEQARHNVQKTVDSEMVKAYWLIGRDIIEEEQKGRERAEYGKAILANLAKKLKEKYTRGFGVDTLEQARKFYLSYPLEEKGKSDALRRKSDLPVFNP